MKFIVAAAMGLAMLAAGCAGKRDAVREYLALGDSYTIGESVAESDRWPVQLARKLKEKGIDLGEPGPIGATRRHRHSLSCPVHAAPKSSV